MHMFNLTTIAIAIRYLNGLLYLRDFTLSQTFPALRGNYCVVTFCFLLGMGPSVSSIVRNTSD